MDATRAEALLTDGDIELLAAEFIEHSSARLLAIRVTLGHRFASMQTKWKASAWRGVSVNNVPRKEIAAYQFQRLLLPPEGWVIPPTAVRCLARSAHRRSMGWAAATFRGTDCVYGILAYWLPSVRDHRDPDLERFWRDPAYRRHVSNLDVLTYLIGHRDGSAGNVLASEGTDGRVWVVDNGLAFGGTENPVASQWRTLRVPAVDRETVRALRTLSSKQLHRLLVLEEYRIEQGHLTKTAHDSPLSLTHGIRREGNTIQLGLTLDEVVAIEQRIHALLQRVDRGFLPTF